VLIVVGVVVKIYYDKNKKKADAQATVYSNNRSSSMTEGMLA
jgi:hypothetical protein